MVGDLPTPALPAAEPIGTRRFPEDSRKSMRRRALEEPLTSAEVARASDQGDLLQEAVNGHYSKPTLVWISHVSGNDAASDLSLIRVAPGDTAGTNIGAELDEALSRKRVEVELQSTLQAHSRTRTRHDCTTPIFVGAHCRRLATKNVAQIDVKNW